MNNFDNKYKEEVYNKWGQTKEYNEYANKTKNYSKDKWKSLNKAMIDIFKDFASYMINQNTFDSNITQDLVNKLQNHISENYYLCTNEILLGLGKMYVHDERFKNNIDKYASGTAEYVFKAIEYYCNK